MPGGFDLSVVLSQTSAIEKVQQIQNPNPDTQQQQFAARFQEERKQLRSHVQDTKGSEETKINPDRKQEGRERNRSKKDDKEEENKPPSSHRRLGIDEGQLIDIKI